LSELVVGVDEVGRGPLAGPVIAAAVILHHARPIAGLDDSKRLSEPVRERLAAQVCSEAVAWAIGRAEVEEIDRVNILQASLLAMQRAVAALSVAPTLALVDGNRAPGFACPGRAIVGGDASEPCISAASIVAKVARDREMMALEALYPGYGFARHKGYPTRAHIEALRQHGVTRIHRRSFGPVRKILLEGS
jgi:ribonuclease HII